MPGGGRFPRQSAVEPRAGGLERIREFGRHAETENAVGRDVLMAAQRAGGFPAIALDQQVQRKIRGHASQCLPRKFGAKCTFEEICFGQVTYQDVNAGPLAVMPLRVTVG